MKNKIVFIFFTFLFLCRAACAFEASVSRTVIPEGESFQLYLRQDGNGAKPDVSVLKDDFLIVSERQSFKSTFINGKAQSFNENVLTLIPKKTGKVVLPSIHAGKEKTSPVTLTVVAGEADLPDDPAARRQAEAVRPNVFIRYSLDNKTPYVGQQIPLTVRLYSFVRTPLLDGTVSPPKADGVTSEQWGDVKRRREVVKDRSYDVLEYRFLLFAQKSGKIELSPASFRGTVNDPEARRDDDEDDFFGMGGSLFSGFFTQKNVAVQTEPIILNVRPIPANALETWLPATNVEVSEDLTPPRKSIALGDAVTRTVTVMAFGIRDSQIPDPVFVDGTGYKQYPGKTDSKNLFDNNGIVGVKTRQIVFMPTAAGTVVLPSMEIPWFDLKTGKTKKAVLPSRTITVTDKNAEAQSSVSGQSSPSASQKENVGPKPRTEQKDDKPDDLSAKASEKAPERENAVKLPEKFVSQAPWRLFVAGLLAGGAAVAFLWLLARFLILRKVEKGLRPVSLQKTDSEDVSSVRKACEKGNAGAVKEALLKWGRRHWPEKPPLTVGELAGRMNSPALSEKADALNKALYGESDGEWNGNDLWLAFKEALDNEKKARENEKIPVPPLYPD